ncbi:MAG: carbohydrate-binding family 9-like protein [bacterium]
MKATLLSIMIVASLVIPVISAPPKALPAEETLPRYVCQWTDSAIVVDGILDDPAWKSAPIVTFRDATDGSPANKRTEARILYNDKMIFFAYHCIDDKITSVMTNRDDEIFNEEVVEVFISPTGDLRYYYEFEVNPLGTLLDLTVKNDFSSEKGSVGMSGDFSWDAKGIQWAAKQEKTGDQVTGWSVEIAIPFADLERSTPKPGEVWRMNLYRIDRDPDEYTAWSPTMQKPAAFHHPQYFGFLEFSAKATVK